MNISTQTEEEEILSYDLSFLLSLCEKMWVCEILFHFCKGAKLGVLKNNFKSILSKLAPHFSRKEFAQQIDPFQKGSSFASIFSEAKKKVVALTDPLVFFMPFPFSTDSDGKYQYWWKALVRAFTAGSKIFVCSFSFYFPKMGRFSKFSNRSNFFKLFDLRAHSF